MSEQLANMLFLIVVFILGGIVGYIWKLLGVLDNKERKDES